MQRKHAPHGARNHDSAISLDEQRRPEIDRLDRIIPAPGHNANPAAAKRRGAGIGHRHREIRRNGGINGGPSRRQDIAADKRRPRFIGYHAPEILLDETDLPLRRTVAAAGDANDSRPQHSDQLTDHGSQPTYSSQDESRALAH